MMPSIHVGWLEQLTDHVAYMMLALEIDTWSYTSWTACSHAATPQRQQHQQNYEFTSYYSLLDEKLAGYCSTKDRLKG